MSESAMCKSKISLLDKVLIVACVAVIGFPVVTVCVGRYRYETLTERMVVGLSTTQSEGYYVSPYHGGRVTEEYMHTGTYEYVIDDVQYAVYMVGYSKTPECDLPKILMIRYDPNDSTRQFISMEDNSEMRLSTTYRIVKTGVVEEGEN